MFIILDDNFLLKSMRKNYFLIAKRLNYGYCEVLIDTTL